MRTRPTTAGVAVLAAAACVLGATAADARDRPFSTSKMTVRPVLDPGFGGATTGGSGQFSARQIEQYRCAVASGAQYGTPAGAMDISCNDREPYRQDFNPDNELAIVVNPKVPTHLLAGSNDYFYRINNSTGARQALVPTGFFTSFDAGASWVDGQVPMKSGNGAGDPSPAFDGKLSGSTPQTGWAMMAQLENVGGLGGPFVSQGNVSVSWSSDGGVTWSRPTIAMKGQGASIGPANNAVFFDKEWLTVDNSPSSPHYGRAYLVAVRFLNDLHGAYAESPVYLATSDDGGRSWSSPREISGSSPQCSAQSTGPSGECDENSFPIPEAAPNGDLVVHFANGNIDSAWETAGEAEQTLLAVRSTDGGATFSNPAVIAHLEDGAADTPWSVIGRQTVTGHQIRWQSPGTITADPTDPDHWAVVYNDNFAGTHDTAPASCLDDIPGTAPDYNPCDAVTDTNIYMAESWDGGTSWNPRIALDSSAGDQWFPWADFHTDGSLAVAYDSNENIADPGGGRNDTFNHVLLTVGPRTATSGAAAVTGREVLVPNGQGRTASEQVDVSLTHWAGQYVPQSAWPTVCGPDGYTDPPVTDAEGKDCNVFDGDYTGLAVGSDNRVNVVWTGLNRSAVSPQVDAYTGSLHDGYAQDAMFARR
ncbi:MAG TPA: sialidase family protein [Ornithinibacter sp.]|nr:sialidase family protein [Ornithinibacter sp.]